MIIYQYLLKLEYKFVKLLTHDDEEIQIGFFQDICKSTFNCIIVGTYQLQC